MTQQLSTSRRTTENAAKGRIVRVTGPVVDVEFPRGAVPELFNALKTEISSRS